MAKQKSHKVAAGDAVKVKDGVKLPEFPERSIAGWTGVVAEQRGRGGDLQYIIEWDDATLATMPQSYRDHCEQHGLFFRMVCLPADQVEARDAEA
ncbi:MAG: hypothetical protein AB7U20_13190 [Planctomycetaceae bacterium]